MEILCVIIYSDEKLVLLHETSPWSPVNLQNHESFNLLQLIKSTNRPSFCHDNFIIFSGQLSFIFCFGLDTCYTHTPSAIKKAVGY